MAALRTDGVHTAEVHDGSPDRVVVILEKIDDSEMRGPAIPHLNPRLRYGDVAVVYRNDDSRRGRGDDRVPRAAAQDADLCGVECRPEAGPPYYGRVRSHSGHVFAFVSTPERKWADDVPAVI